MTGKSSLVLLAAAALVVGACGGSTSSTTSPTTPLSALPHQAKGYELYSWQTGNAWTFVLMTGTDRSKTVEEITTGPDATTDAWVKVSSQGMEAVKSQLSRLPANESISWIGSQTRAQWQLPAGPLALPPPTTVDAVTAYCRSLGLNLHVLP